MRRSQIKKILRFLSTLPALISLDLSEWTDFLDDFVRAPHHMPCVSIYMIGFYFIF